MVNDDNYSIALNTNHSITKQTANFLKPMLEKRNHVTVHGIELGWSIRMHLVEGKL